VVKVPPPDARVYATSALSCLLESEADMKPATASQCAPSMFCPLVTILPDIRLAVVLSLSAPRAAISSFSRKPLFMDYSRLDVSLCPWLYAVIEKRDDFSQMDFFWSFPLN